MKKIPVVNINEKLSLFDEHWSPKIIGQINDFHVKIVKIEDEFLWHCHANEDELFLVLKGTLIMYLKDSTLTVREGEFVVIPKGVEHKPAAEGEAHLLLLEPKSTLNTGDVLNERTVAELENI